MGPEILKSFYSYNIESSTACNCSASDHKALQRVVRMAQYITKMPAIHSHFNHIYMYINQPDLNQPDLTGVCM